MIKSNIFKDGVLEKTYSGDDGKRLALKTYEFARRYKPFKKTNIEWEFE